VPDPLSDRDALDEALRFIEREAEEHLGAVASA